jgi:amidophosphoribosyltransferase
MSDALKHECGIALIRLLKPLEFYKENTELLSTEYKKCIFSWKSSTTAGNGAGFASIKLDVEAGERYISRVRSIMHNLFKMFCSNKRQNK